VLRREPYGKGESHHPSAGGNESKYNAMIRAWIVWRLQAWISSSSKRGLLIACGRVSGGSEPSVSGRIDCVCARVTQSLVSNHWT